jgi:rod shape-determining protein MreD
MKKIFFYLLILLIVIMQITMMPQTNPIIYPNIPLVFIVILSMMRFETTALWWSLLGGSLLDLFSPYPFGFYTFFFITIWLLIHFIINRFIDEPNLWQQTIVTFLIFCLIETVVIIFHRVAVIPVVPILPLVDTVIGLVVYRILLLYSRRKITYKLD